MTKLFFVRMEVAITASLEKAINPPLPPDALVRLSSQLFGQARVSFAKTAHLDSTPRFVEAVRPLVADVLGFLDSSCTHPDATASTASHTFPGAKWHTELAETLAASFRETRLAYLESGSAAALLGNTVHVYKFVRETLGVPMLTGLAKYDVEGIDAHVSRIYSSFQSGEIADAFLAAMKG